MRLAARFQRIFSKSGDILSRLFAQAVLMFLAEFSAAFEIPFAMTFAVSFFGGASC